MGEKCIFPDMAVLDQPTPYSAAGLGHVNEPSGDYIFPPKARLHSQPQNCKLSELFLTCYEVNAN